MELTSGSVYPSIPFHSNQPDSLEDLQTSPIGQGFLAFVSVILSFFLFFHFRILQILNPSWIQPPQTSCIFLFLGKGSI